MNVDLLSTNLTIGSKLSKLMFMFCFSHWGTLIFYLRISFYFLILSISSFFLCNYFCNSYCFLLSSFCLSYFYISTILLFKNYIYYSTAFSNAKLQCIYSVTPSLCSSPPTIRPPFIATVSCPSVFCLFETLFIL